MARKILIKMTRNGQFFVHPALSWAITKWFLLFDGEEPPTRYSLRLNLSLLDVIVFESANATIEMFLADILCSARLYQRDFGL
jgi:hypothetical protein